MKRFAPALLVLLTACAGGSGGAEGPDGGAPASRAPETAVATDAAPDAEGSSEDPLSFSLPDVQGGQVDGAELAGKDVALWFWAPW